MSKNLATGGAPRGIEVPWSFALAWYHLGAGLKGSWARATAGKIPIDPGQSLHDHGVWLFGTARQ